MNILQDNLHSSDAKDEESTTESSETKRKMQAKATRCKVVSFELATTHEDIVHEKQRVGTNLIESQCQTAESERDFGCWCVYNTALQY